MPSKTPDQFDIESYHYHLPQELIAQEPAANRDESRLLALDYTTGSRRDLTFGDIISFFEPGDLLVVNDTRVFPARLLGKKESGGRVELLLLHYPVPLGQPDTTGSPYALAEAAGLVKSSKRPRRGQKLIFGEDLFAEVLEVLPAGKVRVRLGFRGRLGELLERYGQMPLPPYIKRPAGESGQDRTRYQTVYAAEIGAIAAPTAGLHFTPELLGIIREKGVRVESVTLHVGYGTFAPVRVTDIRRHDIHSEFLSVSKDTAEAINEATTGGARVWAVGTTTVRALEFAADEEGQVHEKQGWCSLYIYPGYRFRVVKNLITNFHLPGSSLLFMVSALAGRENMLACYNHAVRCRYRFFSYGDAMVIYGGS